MKHLPLVLITLTALPAGGCATLFAPKHRTIHVDSYPAGAEVLVDGNPAAVTPADVSVTKDSIISLRKPGYADGACSVQTSFHWRYLVFDTWTAGIGLITDVLTNDWTVVDPTHCLAHLAPGQPSPRVELTSSRILIKEKVQFETGMADIRVASFDLLDEVARVMQQHPDLLVEVQGHTDATGGDDVNRRLSADRASSVMRYLERKGVPARRLHARGFGPAVPIGDNATDAGREMNRRVEFHVVRRSAASPS